MRDLYLKATSKADLIALLTENGIILEGNYFQNDTLIIDYIGKVPKVIDPETGDVIEWYVHDRFNVRLIDETVTIFDEMENVYPETPYRIFS